MPQSMTMYRFQTEDLKVEKDGNKLGVVKNYPCRRKQAALCEDYR